MGDGLFADAIEAHRELKRRNARLERTMPLAHYLERPDDAGPSRDVEDEAPAPATPAAAAPWDDPESWWNVDGPAFDWGR
jgi:hypothetical protein